MREQFASVQLRRRATVCRRVWRKLRWLSLLLLGS